MAVVVDPISRLPFNASTQICRGINRPRTMFFCDGASPLRVSILPNTVGWCKYWRGFSIVFSTHVHCLESVLLFRAIRLAT